LRRLSSRSDASGGRTILSVRLSRKVSYVPASSRSERWLPAGWRDGVPRRYPFGRITKAAPRDVAASAGEGRQRSDACGCVLPSADRQDCLSSTGSREATRVSGGRTILSVRLSRKVRFGRPHQGGGAGRRHASRRDASAPTASKAVPPCDVFRREATCEWRTDNPVCPALATSEVWTTAPGWRRGTPPRQPAGRQRSDRLEGGTTLRRLSSRSDA
jgi:hypothetical protein